MCPCFVCFRAFVDANMLKKRRQKVYDQLGGFSQQGAVCTILGKDSHGANLCKSTLSLIYMVYYCLCFLSEAFQRARRKMQEARETLPRDLINSASLLKTESSA